MMHRVAELHALYVFQREQQCRQAQQMPCASMLPISYSDTFCSDTLNISTDPDSLPSFAEECSFRILSLDSYH